MLERQQHQQPRRRPRKNDRRLHTAGGPRRASNAIPLYLRGANRDGAVFPTGYLTTTGVPVGQKVKSLIEGERLHLGVDQGGHDDDGAAGRDMTVPPERDAQRMILLANRRLPDETVSIVARNAGCCGNSARIFSRKFNVPQVTIWDLPGSYVAIWAVEVRKLQMRKPGLEWPLHWSKLVHARCVPALEILALGVVKCH